MTEIEELLKQVKELHLSMVKIKQSKSLTDLEVLTQSRILDIILNNYQEVLMRKIYEFENHRNRNVLY
jgi:Spo0E like sporulation regulatory protein.